MFDYGKEDRSRRGVNTYEIMADQNRKHFLEFDQDFFIRKFHLDADERVIAFQMLKKPYALDRKTGVITENGKAVTVEAQMTVYDMFCHSEKPAFLDGRWTGLTEFGGIVASSHVEHLKDPELLFFAGKTELIRKACISMGGFEKEQGDASFVLPLFEFFPVWMQFWDADDEFPPSMTFLWDQNTMQFLHYETLWYAMGFIKQELRKAVLALE